MDNIENTIILLRYLSHNLLYIIVLSFYVIITLHILQEIYNIKIKEGFIIIIYSLIIWFFITTLFEDFINRINIFFILQGPLEKYNSLELYLNYKDINLNVTPNQKLFNAVIEYFLDIFFGYLRISLVILAFDMLLIIIITIIMIWLYQKFLQK